MLPEMDESRWPVVVITMPRQLMQDEEFSAHLNKLSELWQRGQRFGLVVDVRAAPPLVADRRRQVAEYLDRDVERHPDLLQGVGIVLSGSIQRGIVSVLTWLTRKPFNIQTFATVELASAWVLRGLAGPAKVSKNPRAGAGAVR